MQEQDYDYQFNVLFLGESFIGKSSLFSQYAAIDYAPTIGVDFRHLYYKILNKKTKLHLWDTSGSENFYEVISAFIRITDSALVCFDLTNRNSFNKIDEWIQHVKELGKKNTSIILVGCKADLVEQRAINFSEAQEKSNSLGFPYIEMSKSDKKNIDCLFKILTKQLYAMAVLDTVKQTMSINFANYKKIYEHSSNEFPRIFSEPIPTHQEINLSKKYEDILNEFLLASSVLDVGIYYMQTRNIKTQSDEINEHKQPILSLFTNSPLTNMLQKSLTDLRTLLPYIDDFVPKIREKEEPALSRALTYTLA